MNPKSESNHCKIKNTNGNIFYKNKTVKIAHETVKKSVRHKFFQFSRNLHERVHFLPPCCVTFLVVVENVAAGHFFGKVAQKGH